MSILNLLLAAGAAFLASFAAVGAAFLFAHGRPAAVRHLIFTGAFAVLLVLPLAALLLPSQLVWTLAAPAAQETLPVAPAVAAAPAAQPVFDLADAILLAAALWLAGVLFHLGKALYGAVAAFRLARQSVAHIPAGIDDTPFHGLRWQVRLATARGDAGPLTWGIFRPVVLLPKASLAWPCERLMSVLLHEAAHVRRRDCLARLIAVAASALYWPNPLVWLALRTMRRDGEQAADDCVLSSGVKPSRYAEHLVGLAREFSGAGYAMTLSMAERRLIDTRVEAILDPTQTRTGVTKMDVLKLGTATLALTAALALMRPSLAEQAQPAPEAAAQTAAGPAPSAAPKHVVVRKSVRILRDGTRQVIVADAGDLPPVPPAPPADVAPPAPPAPPADMTPPAPPPPPAPPAHMVRPLAGAADREPTQAEALQGIAAARRALAGMFTRKIAQDAMKAAEKAMRDGKMSEEQIRRFRAGIDIDDLVRKMKMASEMSLKAAEEKVRSEHRQDDDKTDTDSDN